MCYIQQCDTLKCVPEEIRIGAKQIKSYACWEDYAGHKNEAKKKESVKTCICKTAFMVYFRKSHTFCSHFLADTRHLIFFMETA